MQWPIVPSQIILNDCYRSKLIILRIYQLIPFFYNSFIL